jgi:tight adherence protein C
MGAQLQIILGAAAVALAVPILLWGLSGIGRKRTQLAQEALVDQERRVVDEHQLRLQQSARKRFVQPLLASIARRARRLTPAGWVSSLERRVRLAGSPANWGVERVLGVKLLLGIAILLVGIFWIASFSFGGGPLAQTLVRVVAVPLLALVAYLLPDLVLRLRGRDRQLAIQTALPDVLDEMTISVEAGLGFDAALHRVVESGRGPLADELQRTLREISIGVPRKQAFRNLVDRTDVPELRHFVFAVTQADQYGLPVALVLKVQSKELRVIRRQRAEERAMKLPVKIVLPLVFCIFPAMFVVLLVPAAIKIYEALFG